ncbi:cytochrome P450 4X1 [Oryctolagus cuniculus]|uniref:Cytochrome P450 family 4 subfamily X member 1 n=1 Tax=Oryctolagus cuniculus TaxID=9986 RepID=G1SUU6_RABIT|nr:cytochrome P450 4X1 [Oryctolagus cuniculus]
MEASWLETRWVRSLYLAFVFCLALGLLQAIKLHLRRQRLQRDLRSFPAPPAHWFHGHQQFLQDENMEQLEEFMDKYPCAFPCWVGPFQACLFIYDPEYAETVLSRTDPKSQYLSKFMTPCLGRGLGNLDGPTWFQHRRLLTPGFHSNILKTYVAVMARSVNTMLGKWEKIGGAQDTAVEVHEHINLMALDIIMKCAFSKETNCQTNSTHDPYVKAMFELDKILSHRFYNCLHHHDIIFKFSPQGYHFQKLSQVLRQYTEQVLQDRRKSLQGGVKQASAGKTEYQDFLDIVLSAQRENEDSFSDADLQSEMNTFILAGHSTTAASLSWFLYCLALNPEHQERCREEIRDVLGNGSSTTWEQLDELCFTSMCISETFRLFPPVPAVSRELSKPLTFPDGRALPAGMIVVLSIWGLHHNPAVWKNPKVFDPSRFSKENSAQRHPHAFLPFSAGSRNCIGQQFAMLELKVAIALILLRFKVAPASPTPLASSNHVILKPKNGIHLRLQKLPACPIPGYGD